MLGEETLAMSGKPEVINLANQLDRSSLKKVMGIALIDVSVAKVIFFAFLGIIVRL